jgi:hypothetical protein
MDKADKGLIVFGLITILLATAGFVLGAFVIVHFVTKWW